MSMSNCTTRCLMAVPSEAKIGASSFSRFSVVI
jgi:hypothetical protein